VLLRRALTIATSLVALAAPASASAAGLPSLLAGPDQGVTAVKGKDGVRLHFGPKAKPLYAKIAGKRVVVGCADVSFGPPGRYVTDGDGVVGTIRASRRRGSLRMLTGGDFCFVRMPSSGAGSGAPVATVGVTAAGREYLDELNTAVVMLSVTVLGARSVGDEEEEAEPQLPTAAEVVASSRGLAVALDSVDATPPADKVGVFVGPNQVEIVAVTRGGRRLFHEVAGDVIRSNILHLLED